MSKKQKTHDKGKAKQSCTGRQRCPMEGRNLIPGPWGDFHSICSIIPHTTNTPIFWSSNMHMLTHVNALKYICTFLIGEMCAWSQSLF